MSQPAPLTDAADAGCAPSRRDGRRRAGGAPLGALGPILTAALVASILAAPPAHARFGRVSRVVRTTCRDGVAVAPVTEPGCDWDLACDDTCTFAFFCLELCEVNPPPGSPTPGGQLAVPVGHKKVIKRGQLPSIHVTKFILRCLRHPKNVPCPTTTTTETTTTTSTNNSTVPPLACTSNAECQAAGNPCVYLSLRLYPGHGSTCSPEVADRCQSNADCPLLIGDPCIHCDE